MPDTLSLLPYLPLAAMILLTPLLISLFRSLKTEIRQLSQRAESSGELGSTLQRLAGEVGEMRGRLEEREAAGNTPARWVTEGGAINLNRRGQILRLHRRGKGAPEIAAALQISRGEVELMLKLHGGAPGVDWASSSPAL
jgi:hypothetical protein